MSARNIVFDADGYPVTPEVVVEAYWQRCFPMADHRRGKLRWFRPHQRAIITWDRWKVPDSLVRTMRKQPYRITVDRAFPQVIAACAERTSTWICGDIERLYVELHQRGIARSVEAWDADGALVGGLYGLRLGGCFCGESMFHRADDAAKICVVRLAEILRGNGYAMLDCQQQTPHMARFGAYEVADQDYAVRLERCHDERPFP
jgi:leucyl/phenylalanyl-tRNA--protein transferase